MTNKFKKLRIENFLFIFTLTALLFTFGCEQPQTPTNTAATNTAAVNPSPAATASATPQAQTTDSAASLPVTLPVLDAMFADEAFAGELKSKLQLTDEQIDKLKTAAHDAVSTLREDGEQSGSTRAALDNSSNRIKQIVGDEKAPKLFALINQRYNGDENGNTAANNSNEKPNSVPTDTRVVVNAPEYRMDLFQDGKLVKSYKVGIGYPEFPLPTANRKASEIIFNPTWTTPDEPWVEASNKVKVGQVVKAGDKLNPLGPIKIPIGSPSLIHGGKSPAKLGGFASHGCVGMTNGQVQDFALNIAKLAGTELTPEDVKGYALKKTETKNVKLDKSIPVELRYETIVVEDGKLRIFRDVYEKGTNTEENLRAVLQAYGVSFDSLNEQQRAQILDGLKQMAVDATGDAVDPNGGNANGNANGNSNQNSNAKSGDKPKQPKITSTIKGKKEVFFDIAELKGKGYPAPVNLSQS